MRSAPTARLVEIRGGLISAPGRPSVDREETICWEQIAPREIRADRDGGLALARRYIEEPEMRREFLEEIRSRNPWS